MKLSEALRLSNMLGRRVRPDTWSCSDGGCLLHVAGEAVGWKINSDLAATLIWPWLDKPISVPDSFFTLPERKHRYGLFKLRRYPHIYYKYYEKDFAKPLYLLQALAFNVKAGDITIEQVAQWVESIEPKEKKVTEPEMEEVA